MKDLKQQILEDFRKADLWVGTEYDSGEEDPGVKLDKKAVEDFLSSVIDRAYEAGWNDAALSPSDKQKLDEIKKIHDL